MMQSSMISMADRSMQEEDPKSGKDLQRHNNNLSLEMIFYTAEGLHHLALLMFLCRRECD